MRAAAAPLALLALTAAACRFDPSGLSVDRGAGAPDAPTDWTIEQRDRPVCVAGAATETNCLDGCDDDGDGLVDCADPDCAAYECVPAAPGGMAGYYRLHESAWGDPATSCPGTATLATCALGSPSAGNCAPCTCGSLTGATCGFPPIQTWAGVLDCKGAGSDQTAALTKSSCVAGQITDGGSVKVVGDASLTSEGTCTVSGGTPLNPPPWSRKLEACGVETAGGGCSSGYACVPRGATSTVCHRLASGSCGSSWSTTTAFRDWKDNRACTPCVCKPGGTTCKGGSYTFYGDNQTCSSVGCNSPVTVKPGGSCQPFGYTGTHEYSVEPEGASASGGSCTASGGQPTGSVETTPVTFCCPS
jgi:hypothetical protein